MATRSSRYYDYGTEYDLDGNRRGDKSRGQDEVSILRKSRTQDFGDYRYQENTRSSRYYNRGRTRPDEQYRSNQVYSSSPVRDRSVEQKDDNDSQRRARRRRNTVSADYGYDDRGNNGQRRSRSQREAQRQSNQDQPRQRGQNPRSHSSGDERSDSDDPEDFRTRNFDFSFDGWVTGAAGAAIGAITARHFGGPKDFSPEAERQRQRESTADRMRRNWMALGGAAVGAVVANVAETKLKRRFEEEHREHFATGGEYLGEIIAAVGPDVLP